MQAFVTSSFVTLRPPHHRATCSYVPAQVVRCQQHQTIKDTESSAMAAAAATFILKKAADAYINGTKRIDAKRVSVALLELEREQRRHKVKSDINKLLGQWRLVFTADPKARLPFQRSLYFPLCAHQTFTSAEDGTVNEGVFDNGIFCFGGASNFRLSGPLRWTPRRNMLEFTVDRLTVKIGSWKWAKDGLDKEGNTLEGRTAKTLPFFTFFAVRDDVACARGRSGGLALYVRVPEGERL